MKNHQLSYYTFKYRRVLRIPRSRQVSNNLMDGSAFLRTSNPSVFHLNPHSVLARSGPCSPSLLSLNLLPMPHHSPVIALFILTHKPLLRLRNSPQPSPAPSASYSIPTYLLQSWPSFRNAISRAGVDLPRIRGLRAFL